MGIDIAKRQADRMRVLRAVFDASGGTTSEVVRTAPTIQRRLDLSDLDLEAACDYLAATGLIMPTATVNEPPGYIAVQLTARGLDEIENAPPSPESISAAAAADTGTTMADFKEAQAVRALVLKTIYAATNGSLSTSISGQDLLNQLGLPDQELGDACTFLADKRLISSMRTSWGHYTPYIVNITRRGVEEMEKMLSAPDKPTQYLPAISSNVFIGGNVYGSPIQSGSPGAVQNVSSDISISEISDFISKLKAAEPQLEIPEEERAVLRADIATVEAQVCSPRPKQHAISESLHSIRTVLEGAGGALVATGLLDTLQHIHF